MNYEFGGNGPGLYQVAVPRDTRELKNLINDLYKHPIGSVEYDDLRDSIRCLLTEDKYDESLIAFKSKMHIDYHLEVEDETKDDLNNIRGIKRPDSFIDLFSNDKTFLEDQRFEIIKRRNLEYNPEYKQLVVAAYITDGRHIILLHTGDNGETRIENKYTFIQGHVDFAPEAYLTPQNDFLLKNLVREFTEEVDISNETLKSLGDFNRRFYVNDNSNFIGLEHLGIIYELRIEDAAYLYKSLSSREQTKHKVEILNLRNYNSFKSKLDSWAQMVIEKLIEEQPLEYKPGYGFDPFRKW
jgi:predicted NUDIX family phosphoesterase